MNCLHCGSVILPTGYCGMCGLNHNFVYKAYNSSNYYYNIGLDRAKVRDLTGAIDALKLSLKYNKRNTQARNLLGLIYYEMSEVVLALSQWVVSANYDESSKNLAVHYIKEIQSNASKLDAINQLAKKYNLTLQYAAQGNKDLAFMQLKKILGAHPHFVNGYLLLALLYMDLGNYDKAKKALKRVIRIDKTNTLAIKYMKEIGMEHRDIMHARDEKEYDFDDEEFQEEDGKKADIGDLVEGRMMEEELGEKSFHIGNYKEINFAKYSLVYVLVGLVLGIAAFSFLILPNKIQSVKDEYTDIKLSYSDEIAKKNVTISNLQGQVADLETANSQLQAQIDATVGENSGTAAYDKLLLGKEYLDSGNVLEAVRCLSGLKEEQFTSDTAKNLYRSILDAGKGDVFDTLYNTGHSAYEAQDYATAIENLALATSVDGEKVDAWYFLGKAYEASGDVISAQSVFEIINSKFPDSQYATGSSGTSAEDTSADDTTDEGEE